MIVVSNKLITAIKLGPIPAYRIAQQARIDPSTLSKLICGIIKVKKGDPRVLAVGNVLGVPAEDCFDESGQNKMAMTWTIFY